MTEQNQNPYQPAPNPYQPQATPNPNANTTNFGTEFAEEQNPANNFGAEFASEQNPLNNVNSQAEHKSAKEHEQKDAKGKQETTNPFATDKGKKSKNDMETKDAKEPKGIGYTDDDRTGGKK